MCRARMCVESKSRTVSGQGRSKDDNNPIMAANSRWAPVYVHQYSCYYSQPFCEVTTVRLT